MLLPMNEDCGKLGAYLQKVRIERNLTLRDVEGATSIRLGHLEAIEEGELTRSISVTYMQGFIRQYADYLGLDSEALIRDYPGVFRPSSDKVEFAYGIGTLEMRSHSGGGVKWFPSLVWAVVIALVIVAAWYFGRLIGLMP